MRKRFNLSASQQAELGLASRGGMFSGSWVNGPNARVHDLKENLPIVRPVIESARMPATAAGMEISGKSLVNS